MILNILSYASYLSEREAKNRSGGVFYMGSNIDKANIPTNGAILIIITVLKHIMSPAVEAEIGSVFLNAKEATFLCTTHNIGRNGTSSTTNTLANRQHNTNRLQ
jgi:hypothetical protein